MLCLCLYAAGQPGGGDVVPCHLHRRLTLRSHWAQGYLEQQLLVNREGVAPSPGHRHSPLGGGAKGDTDNIASSDNVFQQSIIST